MRDRLLVTVVLAGVVVAILVVGASCAGSEPDDTRRQLAEDLVRETDGRLDGDAAACVADALHEEFGEDAFREVLDAAGGRDDGSDVAVRRRVIDAFSGCDALGQIAGSRP